jgi:hypothetical protein
VKAGHDDRRRSDLPRRLGEIIVPALDRLAAGDEARAYSAWARAVGAPVARGTRPKAFRRGQLTVECASSVWANELTYLGPEILRRMDEVAPGHPVRRFRFIIGRLPTAESPGDGKTRSAAGAEGGTDAPPMEAGSSATPAERQQGRPAPEAGAAARARAEEVQDARLRAAIQAALRRSSEEPPRTPAEDPPYG